MLADRYGLPVSTGSREARDAYVAGADCLLAGVAGVREHLGRAIELDPGFALPHVALARGLFLEGNVGQARESAARARELARGATPRERGHVDAIALGVEGKPVESLAAIRAHLAEVPRDAMVLAPASGVFGLIGFSGRQDREPELYELLHGLAPHYGDDWWFNCVHAFAASECGRLDEAWALIEPAMAANPRNAHGAHIKVHVLHEMGEMGKALDYLEGWMPGFDRRGLMHCHLSWHVALTALTLGETERAWEAYGSAVHPGGSWGPALNAVTDGVAFLWRAGWSCGAKSVTMRCSRSRRPGCRSRTCTRRSRARRPATRPRSTGSSARCASGSRRESSRPARSPRRSPRRSPHTRGRTGTRRSGCSSRRCRKRCASAAAARSATSSSTR